MTFINFCKINVSLLAILCCVSPASAVYQMAWDNPNMNMASGSLKPGYANLTWSTGTVLPIKTRAGMATLVTLPAGEKIADIVTGNEALFHIDANPGDSSMYITPTDENNGNDKNMIVTGESGNKYIFYLRAYPINSSDITYSQVDISAGSGANVVISNNAPAPSGSMGSIFKKTSQKTSTIGVDGEDYGWIKTMKIDPSEFRFDLDIFVPNPDDYVIAPERVWRDRIFTYIDFGDKVISMTQRPVVSLLVEGGESPVGFRTDGEDGRLLIVEAVGDLVLRSGQRIVCIKKRAKPFLIADTASVMALAEANVAQSLAANQSLNAMAYTDEMYAINANVNDYYSTTPTYVSNQPNDLMYATGGVQSVSVSGGPNMIPSERATAGSYLPQSNIPLITSNQTGVAVELKSDTSVKALNDYWTELLAKFSGEDGAGILTPYKNSVFFAVDEQGVGDLGSESATARLYRLRIGPLSDIDTAQKLCDQLLKFSGASCYVVRIQ
ncbi:MAG: TrbG/VirB9 family P-type conjugative transfer protein [Alphaproteobacteria bacterium]|nr:TrbG/VirB9 family P-type conjugative transfer protein [Alphaproteobacteria bacterium]